MTQPVKYIKVEEIKSKWVENIITDWQPPDKGYVEFLKKQIANNEYTAPIVVVQEGEYFYIVKIYYAFLYYLYRNVQNTA